MLSEILEKYVPENQRTFIDNLIFGPRVFRELEFDENVEKSAKEYGFELKGYYWPNSSDGGKERNSSKTTRVGLFQNSILESTDSAIEKQRDALLVLGSQAIEIAARCSVNVFCFQEIWNMPVVFCTQKKLPWVEFAEDAYHGPTSTLLKKLAKKYNMVIISPILERDENDALWNTAVVIDNHGTVLGISRKNHIPIAGKFSEATYYNPSEIGHPVFQTYFGRLAVGICYERHHPQSWLAYGLNGAEIVFNPSATVKTFSEHLWPIEARDAAIQNDYFTCALNRVGTETFKTSEEINAAPEIIGPFFGSSYVTAPDGSRTKELSTTENGLLITDVNLKDRKDNLMDNFRKFKPKLPVLKYTKT